MLSFTKKPKELRAAPRRKILVFANITHKKHSADAYPCVLKDISETGCQVVGPQVNSVNDRFYLNSEAFDEPRLCAVAWRSRSMIGATFVVYETPPAPIEDPSLAATKLGGLAP